MSLRIKLLTVSLLSVAGIAQAGVIIRVESEDIKAGGPLEVSEMKVDGNRMRADSGGEDATTMIFLGDSDEMYFIDHKEKTYMVMDRETIEAMGNKMSEAMKQMEEALKNVPPEQREMVERMMKGKMKGTPTSAPRSEPEVRSLGQSGSVSGFDCDWKEVTRDNVVELKACVCDWTDLPGGAELRQIGLKMKDFASAIVDSLSTTMGPMGVLAENPMSSSMALEGFPLITEDFQNGTLSRRSTFKSIEEGTIADDEFIPPSGYKKQDVAASMRR